jgi:hypothetical protein
VTSPAREQRRARDRKISIILAVIIGVVIGGGAWLVFAYRGQGAGESLQKPPIAATDDRAQINTKAVTLAPHKALYDVRMASSRNGSQIMDLRGQMYYQMHQGCDNYVSDHRFILTYEYADAQPLLVTSDFSTVETMDGRQLDFTSKRRRDGELYQELKGEAKTAPQDGGLATYDEPADQVFELPGGTLFPIAHTKELLAAARAGQKFASKIVFDGSDDQGPVDVTAIIRPATALSLVAGDKVDGTLLENKAWEMKLAFFPRASAVATPEYELSMTLHENGVISRMMIDYQDFTVEQNLRALQTVPADKCP